MERVDQQVVHPFLRNLRIIITLGITQLS
jgi:hypothetical protein